MSNLEEEIFIDYFAKLLLSQVVETEIKSESESGGPPSQSSYEKRESNGFIILHRLTLNL